MGKKGFLKIRAFVLMDGNTERYVVKRNADGSFIPTEEFNNKWIAEEERFRAAVLTFINDVIPDDWAIFFTPFTENLMDARIYCEGVNEYQIIRDIILERLPNQKFHDFYLEGTVNDIDSQWWNFLNGMFSRSGLRCFHFSND